MIKSFSNKAGFIMLAGLSLAMTSLQPIYSQTSPYELMSAVNEGNLPDTRRLVEQENIDVNVVVFLNQTPLLVASSHGFLDLVQYLIFQGADPVYQGGRGGETALHVAAAGGHLEIVRYLLEQTQVDPFQKTYSGNLAIHLAAQRGKLSVVRYFIEDLAHDINIQTATPFEMTPLHFAAGQCDLDLVEYLLANKADATLEARVPGSSSGAKLVPVQLAVKRLKYAGDSLSQELACINVIKRLEGKEQELKTSIH